MEEVLVLPVPQEVPVAAEWWTAVAAEEEVEVPWALANVMMIRPVVLILKALILRVMKLPMLISTSPLPIP